MTHQLGSDGDYQALSVWDITNAFNIELVASFYENDIPPKFFAYIIAKVASIYNRAYVAIENNGVSMATLEYLWRDFEYDNLIHLRTEIQKHQYGIVSTGDRKFDACLHFKELLENPLRKVWIYDGRLIDEMERFEKHTRMGKTPTYSATQGHDDLMMASIWALYVLKIDIIENYYEVKQFATDKLGNQQPLFITSTEYISSSDNELHQFILDLDNKFKNNNNSYELSMNQLEQSIQQSQKELMEHFKLHSNDIEIQDFNNYSERSDEDFQFGRIYYLSRKSLISQTYNQKNNICNNYKANTDKPKPPNN